MKVLKIENKKCFYSTNGTDYNSIVDISKEDIYSILDIIYNSEDFSMDEYSDEVEINNDVEKLIYQNIYTQLNGFIQIKENLKQEIDNEFKEAKEKYKIDLE